MRLFGSLVFSLVIAACAPKANDYGDGADGGAGGGADARRGGGEFADAAPARACQKMDFVFVIDDSGSMGEEQTNLASNFPAFIDVVENYTTSAGDQLDYRIAITTTGRDVDYTIDVFGTQIPFNDRGDNGAFRQECGMTRRWLERGDADVKTTFSCAAKVGTGGPTLEMPLYALELALNDRVSDGTNQNFLRDDALLAVVILTDEDDCSRTDNNFTIPNDQCTGGQAQPVEPIAGYVSMLDTVKGDRGRWATAIIAGPGPGSCSSGFGEAIEAVRLGEFATLTGTNAVFSSICDGDLATALQNAISTFSAACENFPPIE